MPTVIDALRRFLPAYLSTQPVLSGVQHRAVWALQNCRTAVMGGHVHGCEKCPTQRHYAYHSCHHKSCPQCGSAATAEWVRREQGKLIPAPYFMVTFTLPSELRDLFFGKEAKAAYDAFFHASAATLSQTLANKRWLGAASSGFTMVLHTWNQKMLFHPHLHCIVPGAGLDAQGNYVVVKDADYLMPADALKKVLRHHFGAQIKALGLNCDPAVWRKKWGINVQAFGSGENAVKYLGRYIFRSVMSDSRIVSITDTHVTFRYKDRSDRNNPRERTMTLSGIEFVKRHLRHVQPAKLRAVRYYGYHHPAAKKSRQRVQAAGGSNAEARMTNVEATPENQEQRSKNAQPQCPCCQQPMIIIARILPGWKRGAQWVPVQSRAPPSEKGEQRA
jgi:ssDNA-binding Zn-finger/Zn-ribbon topoisomerase 1